MEQMTLEIESSRIEVEVTHEQRTRLLCLMAEAIAAVYSKAQRSRDARAASVRQGASDDLDE